MIKLYSRSASPRKKVFREAIFPAVDDVLVLNTGLSKFVRSCRMISMETYSKVPILNL